MLYEVFFFLPCPTLFFSFSLLYACLCLFWLCSVNLLIRRLFDCTDDRYWPISADTDVFKTSSGRLKKVTTSCDQTRRRQDILQKTSDLRRLEDVRFTSSWWRPIYDVLKTSDLRRLEDVWFMTFWRRLIMTSWRRLIYDVLQTCDLQRLEDLQFTTSWRHLIYVVLKTSDLRRLENV